MKNTTKICLFFVLFAISCSGNVCKYRIQYIPEKVGNLFTKNGFPTICETDTRTRNPQFKVFYIKKNGTKIDLFTNNGFDVNSEGFASEKNFTNCVNKNFDVTKISVDTNNYDRGRLFAYGHQDCPNQCVVYELPQSLIASTIEITYSKKFKRLDIKVVVEPLLHPITDEIICTNCDCATN